jgi:hypothetical protein
LTGYTAAQQLSGLTPYLTEAGMRAGARFAHRRAPRTNTTYGVIQGLPTTAEPTMNNMNTSGPPDPNLITSYGGASAGGQSPVGVVPAERVDRRGRRADVEPTPPTTAETAGSTLASYLDNQEATTKPGPPSNAGGPRPMTAADPAAAPIQSSTSPQAAAAAEAMKKLGLGGNP